MDTPRRTVALLTSRAQRDLSVVWRRMEHAADAEVPLRDVLPRLIETYGAAAATAAATWYDDLRDKRGIRGSFSAIPADVADVGAQSLVGWALSTAASPDTFRTLIEGGTQRRIANFSRQTIAASSIADPKARGWQRVGSGECAFCSMLIGRGAVYSEAGADFASHDHCGCSAVPAFDGEPRPVKPYTPSTRTATDADRARVREYIASH